MEVFRKLNDIFPFILLIFNDEQKIKPMCKQIEPLLK